MVTYEEAYKIAKGLKSNIDTCDERKTAYVFDGGTASFGGDGPAVVLKETGECINFVSFISDYDDHDSLRVFKVN